MAEEKSVTASTISTEDRKRNVLRQLSGTSFLTLEHIGYFVLVVLMPSLLLLGASTALQMWRNGGNSAASDTTFLSYTVQPIMSYVDTSLAIALTAGFLVLTPLMFLLRRRTAAEYAKRPGYTNRVAYKLPVYTALALLAAQTVGAVVSMLGVFLNSLVNIGVKNADIGGMYTSQFLPALLAFAVFGMAAWYVMWFAKGKDASKAFVGGVALLASIMTIALFVTVLTLNHDTKAVEPAQPQPYQIDEDYFRY